MLSDSLNNQKYVVVVDLQLTCDLLYPAAGPGVTLLLFSLKLAPRLAPVLEVLAYL